MNSTLWVYNSENRFVGSFYHNTCRVKRINRFFENNLFWDTLVCMIYVDHSCNIWSYEVLLNSFPWCWKRDDQMYLAASAVPPEGNLPAGRPSIGTELRASNIGRWAPHSLRSALVSRLSPRITTAVWNHPRWSPGAPPSLRSSCSAWCGETTSDQNQKSCGDDND